MQALRVTRPRALLRTVSVVGRRTIAATASPTQAAPAATVSASSVIPLSNVEAQWENLSQQEQLTVHQQLEELQKKDWKSLSLDEKKAGELDFFYLLCTMRLSMIADVLSREVYPLSFHSAKN